MASNDSVVALVVTYNRKELLTRCLTAISTGTRKPDRILVVDNASTDGTRDMLATDGWLERADLELLALPVNTGGAGGFAAGLQHAVGTGAHWVWLMDDDAVPHPDALDQLLDRPLDPGNLYSSVAVCGRTLSWVLIGEGAPSEDTIYRSDQLPEQLEVRYVPFLGVLISAALVHSIGVPDAGFFIAADDIDYCCRAKSYGAKILIVGGSRIEHPASEMYRLWLPGRLFYAIRLPPWKRYYEVRNRLFIARSHFGLALYYSALPGSFLRLFATLWHEPQRLRQAWAFFAGTIDGLLGRKGRRHELWGIRS